MVNTKSLHCSKLGWLTLLLCILCLSNCQIQKRLYRPGWNVDMGRSHATNPIKPTSDTQEKSLHPGLAEKAHEDVPNGHSVAAEAELAEGAEEFETIQPSMLKEKEHESRGAFGRTGKIQSEVQMRGQRLMHPEAS